LQERPAQRTERGVVLAGLHADLRELELGQRPNPFQGCDLDNMADFQDWEPGLAGLREVRPDLANWSAEAMVQAKATIAEHNVLQLPQGVVHGDFAEWNVHFTDNGVPAGVIDRDGSALR
jgi:Ser/Thr protein kinase RdoA (MazF antagonist)